LVGALTYFLGKERRRGACRCQKKWQNTAFLFKGFFAVMLLSSLSADSCDKNFPGNSHEKINALPIVGWKFLHLW